MFCCSNNNSSTNSIWNGSTNISGDDGHCDNYSLKDSGILRCSNVETFWSTDRMSLHKLPYYLKNNETMQENHPQITK